jgi:hypothetical protein
LPICYRKAHFLGRGSNGPGDLLAAEGASLDLVDRRSADLPAFHQVGDRDD